MNNWVVSLYIKCPEIKLKTRFPLKNVSVTFKWKKEMERFGRF